MSSLETVMLGRSDLKVPRLGFGCWQLGGNGWQDIDCKAICAAIEHALSLGINFFDTSDIYGLGESETLLGEVLSANPLGKDAIIASKFGVRMENGKKWYDNSHDWMVKALEGSLKRLQRERIDLYMLHWPDGKRSLEEVFSDLETLRKAGKIGWYGVCNMPFTDIPEPHPPGLVSFSVELSLARRRPLHEEALLKKTDAVSLIAWGGLAQGLLTGKYNRESRFDKADVRSRNNHIFVDRYWPYYESLLHMLGEAATVHDRSMAQTALRWILDSHSHSVALAGIKHSRQLDENLGALDWTLSPEWLAKLTEASNACKKAIEIL
jgi:myo-inositol catabolism protein IolS